MLPLIALSLLAPSASNVSPMITQPAEPKIELKLASDSVRRGGELAGTVVVTFAPGVHGYPNPPGRDYEIPLEVKSIVRTMLLSHVAYPKGKEIDFAGSKTLAYEGRVEIPFKARIRTKQAGPFAGSIEVSYQQCDDSACYPPSSQVIPVRVTLTKG